MVDELVDVEGIYGAVEVQCRCDHWSTRRYLSAIKGSGVGGVGEMKKFRIK